MGPPPPPVPIVRHTESELSSSEADVDDGSKRYKVGSPRTTRAAINITSAASVGGVVGAAGVAGVAGVAGATVAAGTVGAASTVAAGAVGVATSASEGGAKRESRPRRRAFGGVVDANADSVITEAKTITRGLALLWQKWWSMVAVDMRP